MAPTIKGLTNKRRTGRTVQYLVSYEEGQASTWEQRSDLIQDGHSSLITSYETKSKRSKTPVRSRGSSDEAKSGTKSGNTGSGTKGTSANSPKSATRGRFVSKKTAATATPRKSASPSRRSASPKAKATTPSPTKNTTNSTKKAKATPRGRSSRASTPKTSTRRSATPSARNRRTSTPSSSSSEEDNEEEDNDSSSSSQEEEEELSNSTKSTRGKNQVAEMVGQAVTCGWITRALGLFVLIGSMLAQVLLPEITKLLGSHEHALPIIKAIECSTCLPPLICLLLILHTKNTQSFQKWTAVCMVWRLAAEMLLHLPNSAYNEGANSELYHTAAIVSIGVANFAAVTAICCVLGGRKPTGDFLTQGLGLLGAAILFASDGVLVFQNERLQEARFMMMSISLVMMTFSTMLQEA